MNKKEIINDIARICYTSAWGGSTVKDFEECYKLYKNKKMYGWLKEHNAYVAALIIYDNYIKKGR